MSAELNLILLVWKQIVCADHKGIKLSEILAQTKLGAEEVQSALKLLHSLYLIEYLPSSELKEDIIIRRRYILGNPLDDLPCLGCPFIGSCSIGGESASVERCEKFLTWLKSVSEE